jgi:hypothetical protein
MKCSDSSNKEPEEGGKGGRIRRERERERERRKSMT